MRTTYSKELKAFIADHVVGNSVDELCKLINAKFGTSFTNSQIKSYKNNHKLKSGTIGGSPKGESKVFPKEVCEYIHANAKGIGPKEMTERINKMFNTQYTQSQLKSFYANHNITSGLDGRFKKGNISHNKGKKGLYIPGSEKGWFKKGHIAMNRKPVGSERIDTDGYTMIKTAEPNTWRQKHKVIWEAQHGKVPSGYMLTFLDCNKRNITLDNLAIISTAESAVLTMHNLRSSDPAFTQTGILIARLKTTARKRNKELKESETL
jgi:hypothetical protein